MSRWPSLQERFEAAYEIAPTGCWVWTAGVNSGGYGSIRAGGAPRGAHRVSYELHVGDIPDGLELDHLCRNRRCVNPGHLEPVAKRVNILRGEGACAQHARKSHCVKGNPLSGLNLYAWNGFRRCRRCVADAQARRRKRVRGVG